MPRAIKCFADVKKCYRYVLAAHERSVDIALETKQCIHRRSLRTEAELQPVDAMTDFFPQPFENHTLKHLAHNRRQRDRTIVGDVAPVDAAWLQDCAHISLLATSQGPLHFSS